MKKRSLFFLSLIACLALVNLGMARHGQYDEEAREVERQAKAARKAGGVNNPAVGIATGVKEAAIDGPTGFLTDTASTIREEEGPIVGTLEGARRGTGKVLDSVVKGGAKVATLGFGEVNEYKVTEPEAGRGDETTKITIKIPGT